MLSAGHMGKDLIQTFHCHPSLCCSYDQVEYMEAGLPNTHKISIQFMFHLQLSDFKIKALNFEVRLTVSRISCDGKIYSDP